MPNILLPKKIRNRHHQNSNLIASADVTSTKELLDFAEKVGPHIVALKRTSILFSDFDSDKTILPLKRFGYKTQFSFDGR